MIVFEAPAGEAWQRRAAFGGIHASVDVDSPAVCGGGELPLWSVRRREVATAREAAAGVTCHDCRAWCLREASKSPESTSK